ncbi:NAD(P)H-hydrate epimerase [Johnsonella ignava]|uniref:NAD(P)H-hydrate epimerase n=1 Tax=Johnsonella ignava TaxID=43995 RepID=UPI0023F109AB|nr:NAD(P)H-hydrate epimerase [Johnsonella ignava]
MEKKTIIKEGEKMQERVLSVEEMREADRYTIENYISSKELMYRAGEAIFNALAKNRKNTAIICGSGNNAGDGYVLAGLLKEHNISCKLFLIEDKFSEDGRYYFDKCKENNIDYEFITDDSGYTDFECIVDCIYGTGFKGKVKDNVRAIMEKINSSKAYKVSVDINSGMNGDTGEADICVRSDLTISIGYLKHGLLSENARKNIGKLINVDIGIVLP